MILRWRQKMVLLQCGKTEEIIDKMFKVGSVMQT